MGDLIAAGGCALTLMRQKALQTENSHSTTDYYVEHCTTLAVGADTEWVEQVHRKAHRMCADHRRSIAASDLLQSPPRE